MTKFRFEKYEVSSEMIYFYLHRNERMNLEISSIKRYANVREKSISSID